MSGAPKIQLCRLFERTSARGNRYISGRLGNAKVIAFEAADLPDAERYGADVVWNVYLQAPDEERDQAPRQNAERGQRAHDRARDAGRAQGAGEAVLRDARQPRMPEPPSDWLDDSAAAIADLEGRGR
jgi:hypothetical protein